MGGGGGVTATVAVNVADYPDGSGKVLLVPISVNGSATIDVLLDTGSDGLRVFRDALQGTSVDITTTPVDVEFGFGERMVGHLATAEVSFGSATTSGPVAFHLVESFECTPAVPDCGFATGEPSFLTDAGVDGILGVSTRTGEVAELYSPFAQLDDPLSTGFVIRTGGFESGAGEIEFGLAPSAVSGFERIDLAPMGVHPNAVPAWRDDSVETCFAVNGVAVVPPCTDSVFDTGSSTEVIHAPNLPPGTVQDGSLAPGVSFRARVDPVFDLELVVGATPTPSVDFVLIDDVEPFALLGVGVFLRFDVLYDLEAGKLGFRRR